MNLAVVVQTCDKYEGYWDGMWHFMERNWDFGIPASIHLCSETRPTKAPKWCRTIGVGPGTFVENLKKCMDSIDEDNVFLLLEDFWPIAPMKGEMFRMLYEEFEEESWDALQVSNYTPYYKLRKTQKSILGSPIMEFEADSEWIFNFQARFWRKEKLLSHLVEPEISERAVGSAISVEMECDRLARERGELRAGLFHYFWYPLSGVSYRGEMTDFGRHLNNVLLVDRHVERLFSQQPSDVAPQECSL